MSAPSLDKRNRETARGASGVRVNPGHWASVNIHAFRRWTGETTLLTWCGVAVDVAESGKLTGETVSCSGCARASLLAFLET